MTPFWGSSSSNLPDYYDLGDNEQGAAIRLGFDQIKAAPPGFPEPAQPAQLTWGGPSWDGAAAEASGEYYSTDAVEPDYDADVTAPYHGTESHDGNSFAVVNLTITTADYTGRYMYEWDTAEGARCRTEASDWEVSERPDEYTQSHVPGGVLEQADRAISRRLVPRMTLDSTHVSQSSCRLLAVELDRPRPSVSHAMGKLTFQLDLIWLDLGATGLFSEQYF